MTFWEVADYLDKLIDTSDPDLDQQLDHRDAVKIDKACIENGLTPFLLRAHEYLRPDTTPFQTMK